MEDNRYVSLEEFEIGDGLLFVGPRGLDKQGSDIRTVLPPKIRGSWSFSSMSDGIYRSPRESSGPMPRVRGNFHITGKLDVDGLIDPTGLELTPQGSNPGGVAANRLWLNSGDSNKLYQGSSAVGGSTSAFEHVRLALTNNSLATQSSGVNYFLNLANTSDFSNTGNTTNIVVTDDTYDYVLLKAGGMYLVVVSVEMFTSSGTAAQDFWLQLGNGTSSNAERRNWGTARRKVKASSGSSDCAWNAQKSVVIDVPSGGSDEKLYVIPYVNGVSFTVRAFDNNRTNLTITRIGVSTS